MDLDLNMLARLREVARLLNEARSPGDQRRAITDAVETARAYQRHGVELIDIANAPGEAENTLKQWIRAWDTEKRHAPGALEQHLRYSPGGLLLLPGHQRRSDREHRDYSGASRIEIDIDTPVSMSSDEGRPRGDPIRVLVACGYSGNSYGPEFARVRGALAGPDYVVREKHSVTLPELDHELRTFKPHILHLAGHRDYPGVQMTKTCGESLWVDPWAVITTVVQCEVHFTLVVLAFCRSAELLGKLDDHAQHAIGWNGTFCDGDAEAFAGVMYPRLQASRDYPRAFSQTKTELRQSRDVAEMLQIRPAVAGAR